LHIHEKYGRALTSANLIKDDENKLPEEDSTASELKTESIDKKIGLFTAPLPGLKLIGAPEELKVAD
jgi:hypothetical protein